MANGANENPQPIAAAGLALAPIKFGLGGVPFGNEFEVVSDEAAHKTPRTFSRHRISTT